MRKILSALAAISSYAFTPQQRKSQQNKICDRLVQEDTLLCHCPKQDWGYRRLSIKISRYRLHTSYLGHERLVVLYDYLSDGSY